MAAKKISYRDCPIAIVGMGGLFPGGLDPRGLWNAVLAGKWMGVEPPAGRWVLPPDAIRESEGIHPDKVRSTTVCAIDPYPLPPQTAGVFARAPSPPEWNDPPIRLALHAGTEAWKSAKLEQVDPQRIGVVLGNIVLPTTAAARRAEAVFGNRGKPAASPSVWDDLTVAMPSAALAAHLGLGGGHQTLDAACASSLYSLHLAALELMAGRLDAVFAGGVSSPDSLYTQMGFSQLRALSPTGRCRPFDRAADGLIVGEGAGIFVLKRLADARRAQDEILAVIAGIGLSNDIEGGLLAPSTEGQLRAMRQAYRAAGFAEGDADYFECHATGAPVGDRVELETLGQLLGPRDPRAKVPIGSVKGNIGHLLTAAGGAALAKVIGAISAKRIAAMPGTVGLEKDFGDPGCPVFLPETDSSWTARGNRPRRAGISAFGFGGINAHLVVEEPPAKAVSVAVPSQPEVPLPAALVEPVVQVTALARAGCLLENNAQVPGRIRVGGNRFRIPPIEIQSMLPQQIWALEAACDLAAQKEWEAEQPATAVVLQVALDPATTNHHLRWKALAEGFDESAIPSVLDANKVMGSLASIAASRIARQLKLGGPCFTISSGSGGISQAVRVAQGLLAGGSIDRVIVGAVTSPDDLRSTLPPGSDGGGCGGAVLLVLERESGAQGRAKPGLVRLFGTAIASFDACQSAAPQSARAIEAALECGFASAASHPDAVTWLGTSASGSDLSSPLDRELGDFFGPRIKPRLRFLDDGAADGFSHQASQKSLGFLSAWQRLARAVEAIDSARYPGHGVLANSAMRTGGGRPDLIGLIQASEPMPWLVDRENRPRTAMIASAGAEGNASVLLLQEVARPAVVGCPSPEIWPEALFLIEEDHRDLLKNALARLEALAQSRAWSSPRHLADAWARAAAPRPQAKLGLALVLRANGALDELLAQAHALLGDAPGLTGATRSGEVYFQAEPLGPKAGICLVYPGSGQAAFDMGRRLALAFPDVLEAQAALSVSAQASFVPLKFWSGNPADAATADPREQIMAQISHGCLATAILGALGMEPAFALGQSLGESTMMFALGAWPQRDKMLGELMSSSLFVRDVVRPWDAVRKSWNLPAGTNVDWAQALFALNLGAIRSAIAPDQRAYPLIELTPRLNLVGGDRASVAALAQKLKVEPIWLPGGTSVHGPMAAPIAKAWRALHHGPVILVPGMRMFLAGCPAAMPPVSDIVAESFVEAAITPISFVELVRRAYGAGARFFLEVGPGASCAGLIPSILGDNRHAVCALAARPEEERSGLLGVVGSLIAARIPLEREALGRLLFLPEENGAKTPAKAPLGWVEVAYGPPVMPGNTPAKLSSEVPAASAPSERHPDPLPEFAAFAPPFTPSLAPAPFEPSPLFAEQGSVLSAPASRQDSEPFQRAVHISLLEHETQEAFLRFARAGEALVGQIHQLGLPAAGMAVVEPAEISDQIPAVRRALDRSQCLDFAIGSVARALGSDFAVADTYPTRVRLPDEPLMLVDRVLSIEGEPQSMKSGRVVTEHDVLVNGWYLDQGRMPISLTVESGQADMLLAGWLGIDLHAKGEAVYRLLDATIAFEGPLPKPGETIRYDIRVLRFFQHGETWLFRFEYDGSVGGRPLLRMREGCAGFFTNEALAAGKGLLERDFPPMAASSKAGSAPALGERELDRLRQGDLAGAFGPEFAGHPVARPATIPGGKMALFDRVVELDTRGGVAGLGRVVTEDDIHPDDWFLTCHFIDDQVMPGTLMYEACLLSLRVLLLRKGWVAQAGSVTFEGVPGVESALKCRGQVIRSTRVARYEIEIAEIREGENPSVIAHAVMFADGRPIVSVRAMSLMLQGADSRHFAPLGEKETAIAEAAVGRGAQFPASPKTADPSLPMDHPRLLEFCTGLPSRAFGERFLPFDHDRIMARLPRPPYLFMDDVVEFQGEPLAQTAPKACIARFRLNKGDWWDKAGKHGRIPLAVLLEIALQPCGWISAYSGAALTSGEDLSYRNLGGTGNLRADPIVRDGLIEVHAKLERVSRSGGMILHFFTFDVRLDGEPLYDGTTYFGFFTKGALATQVGITDKAPWQSSKPGLSQPGNSFRALPSAPLLMLDRVEQFEFDGGPNGLGFAKGTKKVNPSEWFFGAHFYQDPVMPGSLGLEAFLQLAGLLADPHRSPDRPALLQPGAPAHAWVYRGQVIPTHDTIVTRVEVIERQPGRIVANGYVEIDGRIIYSMEKFAVAVV